MEFKKEEPRSRSPDARDLKLERIDSKEEKKPEEKKPEEKKDEKKK